MSACKHQRWEPVESVVDDERLANVCVDCLERLPVDYAGDVSAIQTFDGTVIRYVPA